MTCPRRTTLFTLVEMLVVIAIIAILMSMLLPALKKAARQAWIAVCAANEQQLGCMVHMYIEDFEGYLPSQTNCFQATWNLQTPLDDTTGRWPYAQAATYLGHLVKAGYVSSEKVFYCPDQTMSGRFFQSFEAPSLFWTNWNSGGYTLTTYAQRDTPDVSFYGYSRMDREIGDDKFLWSGKKGFFACFWADREMVHDPDQWRLYDTVPHGGMGYNVGFLDGHVQWWSDLPVNNTNPATGRPFSTNFNGSGRSLHDENNPEGYGLWPLLDQQGL